MPNIRSPTSHSNYILNRVIHSKKVANTLWNVCLPNMGVAGYHIDCWIMLRGGWKKWILINSCKSTNDNLLYKLFSDCSHHGVESSANLRSMLHMNQFLTLGKKHIQNTYLTHWRKPDDRSFKMLPRPLGLELGFHSLTCTHYSLPRDNSQLAVRIL
jgi:hypothetical protein